MAQNNQPNQSYISRLWEQYGPDLSTDHGKALVGAALLTAAGLAFSSCGDRDHCCHDHKAKTEKAYVQKKNYTPAVQTKKVIAVKQSELENTVLESERQLPTQPEPQSEEYIPPSRRQGSIVIQTAQRQPQIPRPHYTNQPSQTKAPSEECQTQAASYIRDRKLEALTDEFFYHVQQRNDGYKFIRRSDSHGVVNHAANILNRYELKNGVSYQSIDAFLETYQGIINSLPQNERNQHNDWMRFYARYFNENGGKRYDALSTKQAVGVMRYLVDLIQNADNRAVAVGNNRRLAYVAAAALIGGAVSNHGHDNHNGPVDPINPTPRGNGPRFLKGGNGVQ
jgi:hypothetical protein